MGRETVGCRERQVGGEIETQVDGNRDTGGWKERDRWVEIERETKNVSQLLLLSNHVAAGVPGEEPRCSMCQEAELNSDSQSNQNNQILICGKCGIGE